MVFLSNLLHKPNPHPVSPSFPPCQDKFGFTPLARAAINNNKQVATLLLSRPETHAQIAAGDDAATNSGNTALHLAARAGLFGMLDILTSFPAVRTEVRDVLGMCV